MTDGVVSRNPHRWYRYEHLQHQNSIRLIQIQNNGSLHGAIRCVMRHATTEDDYCCLSYVWGSKRDEISILVNGKSFRVRHGLHTFLEVARRRPHLRNTWLWIDAICIDQNSPLERNHQVQQMGRIFSNARTVFCWLGHETCIGSFFSLGNNYMPPPAVSNPYWNRAWVTQEFVLARELSIITADSQMTLQEMETAHRMLNKQSIMDLTVTKRQPVGARLWSLIHRFRDKECSLPRDRIFSLLALCSDGTDVQVDYQASERELACSLLRTMERPFCLCAFHLISSILPASEALIDPGSNSTDSSQSTFAYITLDLAPDHDRGDKCGKYQVCCHETEEHGILQVFWTFRLSAICGGFTDRGVLAIRDPLDFDQDVIATICGSSHSDYILINRNGFASYTVYDDIRDQYRATLRFSFDFLLGTTGILLSGDSPRYCGNVDEMSLFTSWPSPYTIKICDSTKPAFMVNHAPFKKFYGSDIVATCYDFSIADDLEDEDLGLKRFAYQAACISPCPQFEPGSDSGPWSRHESENVRVLDMDIELDYGSTVCHFAKAAEREALQCATFKHPGRCILRMKRSGGNDPVTVGDVLLQVQAFCRTHKARIWAAIEERAQYFEELRGLRRWHGDTMPRNNSSPESAYEDTSKSIMALEDAFNLLVEKFDDPSNTGGMAPRLTLCAQYKDLGGVAK